MARASLDMLLQPLAGFIYRSGKTGHHWFHQIGSNSVVILEIFIESLLCGIQVVVDRYRQIGCAGQLLRATTSVSRNFLNFLPVRSNCFRVWSNRKPTVQVTCGTFQASPGRSTSPNWRSAWPIWHYSQCLAVHVPSTIPFNCLTAPKGLAQPNAFHHSACAFFKRDAGGLKFSADVW